MSQSRHLGILLFEGVEELDAVGPYEVLAYWAQTYPEDGWSVTTFSRTGQPVTGAKRLTMQPHHSFSDAPKWDVLLHPGGRGTRPLLKDVEHLDWVRGQRDTVPLLTSVCTGSLVYAAAGFLKHRPATTHWGAMDELRALEPTALLDSEARFIDDGDIVTSAGISAGIDMALHLVGRLSSPGRAEEVRRGIQYDRPAARPST
jgi:transcriptional regulator GlxA family with amidase domain